MWRVTGESEYLDIALQTGHSMARDFATGNTWQSDPRHCPASTLYTGQASGRGSPGVIS